MERIGCNLREEKSSSLRSFKYIPIIHTHSLKRGCFTIIYSFTVGFQHGKMNLVKITFLVFE